jgi:hypothetical protein
MLFDCAVNSYLMWPYLELTDQASRQNMLHMLCNQIKEAYFVTDDGDTQYVCIVLFKRFAQTASGAATLPYMIGLMPCTIVAKRMPGRDYNLTAYMMNHSTDDPVLAMLKRPSSHKKYWHAAANSSRP